MLFWANMTNIWPRWLGKNLSVASFYVYGASKSAPWKENHPRILYDVGTSKLREFQEWIPKNSPVVILSQAWSYVGRKNLGEFTINTVLHSFNWILVKILHSCLIAPLSRLSLSTFLLAFEIPFSFDLWCHISIYTFHSTLYHQSQKKHQL